MTAGLLTHQHLAEAPAPSDALSKWTILKDLTAARAAFGISDRTLSVLNALVSFHHSPSLADGDDTIVFPSNRALSERSHGMAESTLRRHLGALVEAGLILRHDSPNGKRYAVRGQGGAVSRAFGFDLRPLLVRAAEIAAAAQAAREAAERLRCLRERAVLHLRDVAKLIAYAQSEGLCGEWASLETRLRDAQSRLRRKPEAGYLSELCKTAEALREDVEAHLNLTETEETSGNAVENERHFQDSNRITIESEPCKEKQEASVEPAEPRLPLHLVLKACPDILDFASHGIRHWHQLVATAEHVRPMMGISRDAWANCKQQMGAETAAIAVAGILQRGPEIERPGGYLRALGEKAEKRAFSPGPMIMALLRAGDRAGKTPQC